MTTSDNQSIDRPARQRSPRRRLLLVALLAALIALLWARPDIRKPAGAWAEQTTHHLLFDVAGVSPRTVYGWRLRLAGLYDRPLGRAWRDAVDRAQEQGTTFHHRLATRVDFRSDRISARVLTTHLERGEAIRWRLMRDDGDQPERGRLYATLEYRPDSNSRWQQISALAADDADHRQIAPGTGDYRLILQPELAASVTGALAVAVGGSIDMPVVGAGPQDIGGGFGAARDGGRRLHKGVDIFAKRNTPVRAVVDGRIRTGNGGLGGHYIFLSASSLGRLGAPSYYYAHLDHFAVDDGTQVHAGEVIGYVGNSGNAAGGPTHLHFGIYTGSGAIDPAPFIAPMPELPSLPRSSS